MPNSKTVKSKIARPYFPSPPMLTKWGVDFNQETAWKSYPRPQFKRREWLNLNGMWEYAISDKNAQEMPPPEGQIRVPFPIESYLSGVQRTLTPRQILWYHRRFIIPPEWHDRRIILHFGAVDWEASVFVNGEMVGNHKGGYNPFSFDISPFVKKDSGAENSLIVKVYDPSEKGHQPSGKQWLKPAAVFYTPVSGIWQTVWIEPVGKIKISGMRLIPDIDRDELSITFIAPDIDREPSLSVEINIYSQKNHVEPVFNEKFPYQENIKLKLPPLSRWTPETPELFDLQITLQNDREVLDEVSSYFAMRKFSLEQDSKGIYRFHLNNKPYFMIGVLDQGYWPDGLYTAPNEDAFLYDLEFLKKCGFNMVRKHIKVETALWYNYCDRLGLIVWQDMPNGGGKGVVARSFLMHLLHLNPADDKSYWLSGYNQKEVRENFWKELLEMIMNLFNFPSIAIWVLFNEGWGQFNTERLAQELMSWDETRLVDAASGWFDKKIGHFFSVHNYTDNFKLRNSDLKKIKERGVVLSETGGYTLPISGHLWNPKKKFGYKRIKSQSELEEAYFNLIDSVITANILKGLTGVVYTQISDVEIEYNGLMTYDRKVCKVEFEKIREKNSELLENHQKLL